MKNEQMFRESFRKFDVDPTEGKITAAGLREILEKDYNLILTLQYAQDLVNKYAPAGSNGYLNEDGFVQVMKNTKGAKCEDNGEYKKLFRMFDQDGNGFIDQMELQIGMEILVGKPIKPDDIRSIYLKFEAGEKGVGFDDFTGNEKCCVLFLFDFCLKVRHFLKTLFLKRFTMNYWLNINKCIRNIFEKNDF